MISYTRHPQFEKDFKKLLKRFRTLEEDFETLKRFAIEPHHTKNLPTGIVPVAGYCGEDYATCKVRKFACRSLKGRGGSSGLRVIYIYRPSCKRIDFLEIYFKGDKENEDHSRIEAFIRNITQ